jgi:hypothetical protein
MPKNHNIKVSAETHRKIKILSAVLGLDEGQIVEGALRASLEKGKR